MREDDAGVAVLAYLAHSSLNLAYQELNILVADEGGEVITELSLLAPQVADAAQTGVEHIALAQQTRRVQKH